MSALDPLSNIQVYTEMTERNLVRSMRSIKLFLGLLSAIVALIYAYANLEAVFEPSFMIPLLLLVGMFGVPLIDMRRDLADLRRARREGTPPKTPFGAPLCATEQRLKDELGRTPWVTGALVAIVVALFGGLALTETSEPALEMFASSGRLVLEGEPWRLITAMFMHVSPLHIGLNAIGLWLVGREFESFFGRRALLLTFFIGGLGGTVASAVLSTVRTVGASGAVFALAGGMMLARPKWGSRMPRLVSQFVSAPVAMCGLGLLTSGFIPRVDNWAHLGGTLTGLALTYVLFRPRPRLVEIAGEQAAYEFSRAY